MNRVIRSAVVLRWSQLVFLGCSTVLRLGCGSALTEWNAIYEAVTEDIENVLFVNEYGGFELWVSCRWMRPLGSISISTARTRMKKPNIKTMLGCDENSERISFAYSC
ncbi:hypothetical protein-signal peptide prediction [Rhodopirellula baltica SH 1]|uniref:Uncharacterized protein n=1 Tax=Rhodopirellula baltica (strain DSM 10527 / NCIMB 13988 / SH1) TaxID=243090 RepID=Q7UM52_RHOBA|nr:hypothetical protein-signal peptide prediction [Rhodopirellula baltica SH 1]